MKKFSMIEALRMLQSALQRRLDQLQSQGLREVLAIAAKSGFKYVSRLNPIRIVELGSFEI